jgi:cell division protease FtsH
MHVIPVGGGRRDFVAAFAEDPHVEAGGAVVLVTPREHLARLWREGLVGRLGAARVARLRNAPGGLPDTGVVLIETPAAALRHLVETPPGPVILVIDEPDRLAADQRQRFAELPCARRVWLYLDAPASATDGSGTIAQQSGPLTRGGPRVSETATSRMLPPRDVEVGRTVAGLLDAELERRAPASFESWARAHLSIARPRTYVSFVHGHQQDLAALGLRQLLATATTVVGPEGDEEPRWTVLAGRQRTVEIPHALRAVFPPGALTTGTVAVSFTRRDDDTTLLEVVGRPDDARQVTGRLLAASSVDQHPYRGETLELSAKSRELHIDVVARPDDRRDDLVLPDEIWRVVDRDLLGVLRHRDRLRTLGLGVNRGVLFHGPPGTGKTQLVRTVLAELGSEVTALLPRPEVISTMLAEVYELAQLLAPSVVVLEDADLAIKARGEATSVALAEFLQSVDGLMVDHAGVLTVATTNDVASLDTAATRAARFDRIVAVPLPPRLGRRRLWERYLRDTGMQDIDLDELVRRSDGCSGAEIREVVRAAILDGDGAVTMTGLLERLQDRDGDPLPQGLYL